MPDGRLSVIHIGEGSGPPPIRGADFSGTAFLGPMLAGPTGAVSDALSSFAEFEKLYGDLNDLDLNLPPEQRRNHMALAARAYFENGGRRLFVMRLAKDSALPAPSDYHAALDALSTFAGISVIAAPGSSARSRDVYLAIRKTLQDHVADTSLHRFAVLEAPPGIDPAAMRNLRGSDDIQRSAIYYPWVAVADPNPPSNDDTVPILTPPSGFVCGVYERVAAERGLWAAPANQPPKGALGVERDLTQPEAELLSDIGVNVLRTFPGLGPRIWGARTLSDDGVWKYINVRRFLDYLEHSIDEGTQWAVFEPNGERLWTAVRRVVEDFLLTNWRSGGLVGASPEEAFFVRCDRTVMTQEDIDNGRLIILIGVAPLRAAEFVLFRIGQWTQPGDDDDS